MVQFRPGTPEGQVQQALERSGARQDGVIGALGVRIIRVPDGRREPVVAALRQRPEVVFAEVDEEVAPNVVPDDPSYPLQWQLPKINAPGAWEVTTGSSGVVVAVLDTGVNAAHPDLGGLVVAGWNIDADNADTADVTGHGTSVAGAAVARGDNALGGAAPAWDCRLMPIRVSNASGNATFSAMAAGLVYAADHGARVANVSFHGAARSATVQAAATYFATKGGLTVASAGNGGDDYPDADHPAILAVGATTEADGLAGFSDRGPYIDLTAPGASVYVPSLNGDYAYRSGSSLAAPIAAGVAALLFSVDAGLTPEGAVEILKATAVDLGAPGADTSFGSGRVNAAAAVILARDNRPPVAPVFSLAAYRNEAGTFAVDTLLAGATDPDNDPVVVAALARTSTAGGVVEMDGTHIRYTPPAGFTGADTFTYTLGDGAGGRTVGTVSVMVQARPAALNELAITIDAEGVPTVHSTGIPWSSYAVEASTDLQQWARIATVGVPADGLFEFSDPDAPLHPVRFYRTRGL